MICRSGLKFLLTLPKFHFWGIVGNPLGDCRQCNNVSRYCRHEYSPIFWWT